MSELRRALRGLSPGPQRALMALWVLQDGGKVTHATAAVVDLLCVDTRNARRWLAELERFSLVKRKGRTVFVRCMRRMGLSSPCIGCGGVQTVKANAYCAKCRQTVGHADRKWYADAIDMAISGRSPAHISQVLVVPLFAPSTELKKDQGGSVVELLMKEGLCPPQWRTAYANFKRHGSAGVFDE